MSDNQANLDRLDEMVAQAMARTRVPGVVVGILHEGEIYSAGFGVTSTDHPLAVTKETLFQIGSITKTFTATATMRLVEMGKLDLDATVRTYLPEFKVSDEAASSHATIRHLLTHTGGWVGDLFEDTGAGDDALPRYMACMAGLEQLAPLGTVWSYNNAGFCLAGYVIEAVTGQSYTAALKELVLEPLGLQNVYFDAGDVITHRFAVGHHVTGTGAEVSRPWPLSRALYPAGGITCPVGDLLRYASFHMGDGKTPDETGLLTPESMSAMQSPQATIWGEKEAIGLSWFINDVNGTRTISHGGGTNGQSTLLTLVPERQFAVAVFTNANRGGRVTRDVTFWVLKEYLGVEKEDPKPIDSSLEELAPYVGRYVRPFAEIELGLLGGRLVGQVTPKGGFPSRDVPPPPPPPPMSLALCEPDRLLVMDGSMKDAQAEIIRKPGGEIGWLRASGRIHKRILRS
jgi:CubicO group peptidase (beta-lactamase class C family)